MAFIPRIYISEEGTPGGRIFVGGGDASHILRVLRRGKGDGIFVCDTRSVSYDAVIDEVTPEGFYAVLGQPRVRDAEPVCPVTLYQCLPKGEKTDDLRGILRLLRGPVPDAGGPGRKKDRPL